jgi:hypothetical protein
MTEILNISLKKHKINDWFFIQNENGISLYQGLGSEPMLIMYWSDHNDFIYGYNNIFKFCKNGVQWGMYAMHNFGYEDSLREWCRFISECTSMEEVTLKCQMIR